MTIPSNATRTAHSGETSTELVPPFAERHAVEHVTHRDRRIDEYAWLRDKNDPKVLAYLNEENSFTDAVLKPTEGLQKKLYSEMLGRILQTDLSVPYRLRGYLYYSRTAEGKQYSIYCRKREGSQLTADSSEPQGEVYQEEVLLDLNLLAEGHSFLGLGSFEVSDDNRWLAFSLDRTGYRQYELAVKDLQTSEVLPLQVARVTGVAWAADNRTLFFTVEDETTKRSYQLYRRRVLEEAGGRNGEGLESWMPKAAEAAPTVDSSNKTGGAMGSWGSEGTTLASPEGAFGGNPGETKTPPRLSAGTDQPGELLYEEKDERFRVEVERTRSGAFLLLLVQSHTTSEVRFLRADQPGGEFRLIAVRENDHEYSVDHHPGNSPDPAGGVFFVRTNSNGRTFRLMTAPTREPARARWHEVVENRPGVMLAAVACFATHLVLSEREDGLPYLRIVDLTKELPSALAASHRVDFAEPAYNAAFGENPEFDTEFLRFTYESFITPSSVYDYDLKTGMRILKKQQPVLGGFDATLYRTERLHATASDGAQIPLSVVYRHETPRDGTAPLLLYGYGSYGISIPVAFSSNRLSLLDRGVIFVIAHIRGGGELGKPWHDLGRMHCKMNTFTDFIASAEHLITEKYTSRETLAIEGGSAGGLLMGAVANLRPDLFRLVISHVPFVDVLNTMLDSSLPLTVGEFEEWGNPAVEQDYFYMKDYCPYTNLAAKDYPAMLVKTGWNDSQVMYWEPAKYVARLRSLKTDLNPLLFKVNMGAGHGGASGRYDYLRETALDYAVLLGAMGRGS